MTKRNKNEICSWYPNTIYACCRSCIKVLPALERECANEALEINNFICEECNSINSNIKNSEI